MTKIGLKKTLNLHKYSVRVTDVISNWKFILPIILSIAGLLIGTIIAKGEGAVYKKLSEIFLNNVLNNPVESVYSSIIIYLLIPTFFAVAIFFCGLSVYGGLLSNVIPIGYSAIIGMITYYLYTTYTLKGLAYCVIIIFPYAVLTLLSLILITGESISMSQLLMKNLSKNSRNGNYNFSFYYKNCLKSYVFIIAGAAIKTLLDSLFISLFSF